jgi:hypothetical protein
MCDFPECHSDEIYVWVFWKADEHSLRSLWSCLCKEHYEYVKTLSDDNIYFFMD